MSAPTISRYIRADGTLDVPAITRLAAAATRGPWLTYNARAHVNGTACYTLTALRGPCAHEGTWLADVRCEAEEGGEDVRGNAEFIAAARDLVPALCDRIAELEAENMKLRTARAISSFGERPRF